MHFFVVVRINYRVHMSIVYYSIILCLSQQKQITFLLSFWELSSSSVQSGVSELSVLDKNCCWDVFEFASEILDVSQPGSSFSMSPIKKHTCKHRKVQVSIFSISYIHRNIVIVYLDLLNINTCDWNIMRIVSLLWRFA